MSDDLRWYGMAGHYIGAPRCLFHLTTELPNGLLVSTVGDKRTDPYDWTTAEEIGAERKYETFVFRTAATRCVSDDCGCGMPDLDDAQEIDSLPANTGGEATANHHSLVAKYLHELGVRQ